MRALPHGPRLCRGAAWLYTEGSMTAGHFIFIPATLLVGIIIGWILGSRAATDALRSQMKREEERRKRA